MDEGSESHLVDGFMNGQPSPVPISGAGRLVNEGIVQVVETDGDWVYRSPVQISVPLEISRSGQVVVGESSMLSRR